MNALILNICILKIYVCNLAARTCAEDEFTCKSGHCVPMKWTCDKETDCLDGSDETDICRMFPLNNCI